MARPALRIKVHHKHEKKLRKLLKRGSQPVRVVLRATVLLQLARGVSAPRIAQAIPLTAQAIRKIGHRYEEGRLEAALYDKPRPGGEPLLDRRQLETTHHRHGVWLASSGQRSLDSAADR